MRKRARHFRTHLYPIMRAVTMKEFVCYGILFRKLKNFSAACVRERTCSFE
jgi:hypothetical protein